MPDTADVAFYLIDGGVNAARPAARIPETQVVRLVNARLEGSLITTRPGVRIIPLSGDNLPFYEAGNVQGAIFYNPADGQGAVAVGKDDASLAVAMGGRKFRVRVDGYGYTTTGTLEDITATFTVNANLHHVFLCQWENYLIAGDENSRTYIYDGTNPPFLSQGYNTTDKESSRVPNGGGVMVYSHNRGSIIVNNRFVLTSDLAFSRSKTTAEDVLSFREQVYWATGQHFASKTKMGVINAAGTLPVKDTAHGHGDTIFHCERGVFSLDLNVHPRSSWSDTPIVKDVYLGAGAAGPYALCSRDGDQLFRTISGVKTLRSARAEASMLGAPEQPISDTVRPFFAADSKHLLRYACVASWEMERRAFVTCYPIVNGRYWEHRGMVVLNFDPVEGEKANSAWEGLWTVPIEAGRVCMMVSGSFAGVERFFALCRNAQGKNTLVEFDPSLREDVLADGTRRAIRSQLISRRLDMKRPFTKKNFTQGQLFLANVQGRVDWGVWYRVATERKWRLWRSGFVSNGVPCETVDSLAGNEPIDPGAIELGDIPDEGKTSRYVQFLVRWAGFCAVEAVRLSYGSNDPDAGKFEAAGLQLCIPIDGDPTTDYSDFEYAETEESDSWLAQLPHKQPTT